MPIHALKIVCLLGVLLFPAAARSQAPAPDTLATAKELVVTMRATEQFKAILPMVMQALKPAVAQGRPEVERDFDTLVPIMMQSVEPRLNEVADMIAALYAAHFTAAELRELIAFYRTPTGQKLLDETPTLAQQSMAAGQRLAQSMFEDIRTKIIEELRKKGHKI